jgi:hypothetical protein
VDAIVDVVGTAASEPHIFDAFNPTSPKRYAQVWTGHDEIQAPSGVDSILFRSRDLSQMEGNKNVMLGLQNLLAENKYKLPLPINNVGDGFQALNIGLDVMRKGVSGQ